MGGLAFKGHSTVNGVCLDQDFFYKGYLTSDIFSGSCGLSCVQVDGGGLGIFRQVILYDWGGRETITSIAELGCYRYRGNEATLMGRTFVLVCEWLRMWDVSYSCLLVQGKWGREVFMWGEVLFLSRPQHSLEVNSLGLLL